MINGSLIQEPLIMFVTLCSGSNIACLLKRTKILETWEQGANLCKGHRTSCFIF